MKRLLENKWFFPILLFVGSMALSSSLAFFLKHSRVEQAFELYKHQETENIERSATNVKEVFSLTYDSLRTIAMLPGVRRMTRHPTAFNEDAITSIQQIYNSVASHVAVSEIYIIPADFDPEKIDLKTGQLEEPIITFDQIILGARGDKSDHESKLDEVEIYEYREMKKQIAWFKEHHATIEDVSGIEYPALSSPAVITCDNSEFTKNDLDQGDDRLRLGIVYSVPYYGLKGELKGIVSAVLRTEILKRAVGLAGAALANPDRSLVIGAIPKIDTSLPFGFFQQIKLPIRDNSEWTLTYAKPPISFLSQQSRRSNQDFFIILGMGFLIGLSLAWGTSLLTSTRAKAEALAFEMTSLAQARQAALVNSAKMASLGEMASGMAHEINNPLAIIQVKSDMLRRKLLKEQPKDKELLDEIERISNSSKRIAAIIGGLRTFARNGDSDPFSEVSIKEIVFETLSFCSVRFIENNVELKVKEVPDIKIEARPTQISQIILNLLNNSLDAVANLSEKWVLLEVKPLANGRIQIAVTDSGKGIPAHIAAKLAQPFFTTKEVGKGTGLGLSISHGLAQSHGGFLVLDPSSANTRFVLELNVKQGSSNQNAA